MKLKSSFAAAITATIIAGGALIPSAAASALVVELPQPEVSVTAVTGVLNNGFIIEDVGNTNIPAGAEFTFSSAGAINVGLFGDPELNQQWDIGLFGSGNTVIIRLKDDLQPGESVTLQTARIALSAFQTYTLTLTDPNRDTFDTDPNNNSATISCGLNFFGLTACSAS